MKAKIPFKGSIIEVEGDADEIYDYTMGLLRRREAIPVKIPMKPVVTEVGIPEIPATEVPMPPKEDVVAFISSKGGDFRHTLKEIELHFLERTYDGRIKSEKSPYDMIYNRVQKAREILQKTHGGEWKNRRMPITHEREYWLDRGINKQLTPENYQ